VPMSTSPQLSGGMKHEMSTTKHCLYPQPLSSAHPFANIQLYSHIC
jgi:hypothetical protein